MPVLISLLICLLFILDIGSEVRDKEETTNPLTDEKPLVLQWQVSHPRNVDQTSLIFRQDTVELVTNTHTYQNDDEVRLGWLQSPMNDDLESLRFEVRLYHGYLQETTTMSDLLKDVMTEDMTSRLAGPHAPVIRVSEEEIQRRDPYFESLARIIHGIWEMKEIEWLCVECATYKKAGESVVRTTKKMPDRTRRQWEEEETVFPLPMLDCVPFGEGQVECVDLQFGLFRIPGDL